MDDLKELRALRDRLLQTIDGTPAQLKTEIPR